MSRRERTEAELAEKWGATTHRGPSVPGLPRGSGVAVMSNVNARRMERYAADAEVESES